MAPVPPGGRLEQLLDEGLWRVAVSSSYELREDLYFGSDRIADLLDERTQIWQVFGAVEYAFDAQLSVAATFRWLHIEQELRAMGTRERVTGLGDTAVQARWTPWLERREEPLATWLADEPVYSFTLEAGWLTPTGEPEVPSATPGGTPSSSLQTGTGTFVPLLGFRWRADFGGLALLVAGDMTVPFYENRYDFEPGAFQRVGAGVSVRPVDELALDLLVEYEHSEADEVNGRRVDVGGGQRVLISPSLRYALTPETGLFLSARVPVWRDFETTFLDAPFALSFGFDVSF